jgi:uncharacterized protein (TIGR03435 family)
MVSGTTLKKARGNFAMRAVNIRAALVFFTACAAAAQTTPATPSFEVATVKPAAPPSTTMAMGGMKIAMRMGTRGGPGTSDPGQITYSGMSMKSLLVAAYGVKTYQVSGPSWMDSERFDIVAKVPPGATKDDVKLMLQNLLAERFKLTLHREKKELPMYALMVAKNGPKLKESPPDDPDAKDATAPLDPAAAAAAAEQKAKQRMEDLKRTVERGGDMSKLPPGRGMSMMVMNGRAHMNAPKQTMEQFAEWLSGQLDRPVVDQTALSKKYDVSLDYAPESIGGRGPMGGMIAPPPGGDGAEKAELDAQAAPTLFAALQEQLGLKLEQKKGTVELLVVDRLEKTATEN